MLLAGSLIYQPFDDAAASASVGGQQREQSSTTQPAASEQPFIPGRWLQTSPTSPIPGSLPPEQPVSTNMAAATEEGEGGVVTLAPGTTITWHAADNPHIVNGTYVVPSDTTLVLEPGVVVQINNNSTLLVEGRLLGRGTPDNHVTIRGISNAFSDLVVPGTVEFDYTDFFAQTDPRSGGTLLYRNCHWGNYGTFYSTDYYTERLPPYFQFDHCNFDGDEASLWIQAGTAAIRDVSFTGGAYPWLSYAYLYLDDVRSENGGIKADGLRFGLDGKLYLNNIQVRNNTKAGLYLGGANRGGNYFLGPDNVIEGNAYPVKVDNAGVLPGSHVPATGNTNNYVLADASNGHVDWLGPMVWSPLAVPYVIQEPINLRGGGTWTILPGTTVKFGPNFSGITDESLGVVARGRPDNPIHFERLDPAQPWGNIGNTRGGNRYSHIILEGSSSGINTTTQNGAFAYVEDLIIRNNNVGSGGGVIVTGTRYTDNALGYAIAGTGSGSRGILNGGPASPNSFERNGVAVRASVTIQARNNWWNSPTGPTTPANPSGTGDPIEGSVDFIPFFTAPPDYSDQPPVVRQEELFVTYNPGEKITVKWNSEDDRGIVAHRILFNKAGNYPTQFQTIINDLPADARSYEFTIPAIGFQSTYPYSTIRVVAVDTVGHERFDDQFIQIPSGEMRGELTFTSNIAGQTFRPGERTNITWTAAGYDPTDSDFYIYIVLNDRTFISQGGAFLHYGSWEVKMPYVSTDVARIAVATSSTSNRIKWFYSPYFKIRPDTRIGDAPPSIALTLPADGASYNAGDTVPIAWTASDDESMRSYNLQVSYDNGRAWSMLAEDLPGTTTNYNFQTAPGSGFNSVRFRLTAFDLRFQETSDGAARSISLRPTPPPNLTPRTALTHPTADSSFTAGVSIILRADATDDDGTITRVDFHNGSTLIGSDATAPYEITWSNLPAGNHSLTATATDDRAGTTTSAAVNIVVNAQPAPPTTVPGVRWAAIYNGPSSGNDERPEMLLDSQNNVYLVGLSRGIGTSTDIAVVKYDTNGNQLWVARFNGTGNGNDIPYNAALDSAGNLYVTGTTWRKYNFDGGTEFDYVTMKFDPQGNRLWTKHYDGNRMNDIPYDLALDASGNVYVTGGSLYIGVFNFAVDRIATIKYDTDGNQLWLQTYDTADRWGATGTGIDVDSQGNVFIAGNVTVATINAHNTDHNIIALKYDVTGNLQWVVQHDTPITHGGEDFDNAERIHVNSQGVYVQGSSIPDGNSYDVLMLKYNPANGQLLAPPRYWSGPNRDDPNDWEFDGAGNIYTTGVSERGYDYGYFFTLKFDASLNLQWERLYNGPYPDAFDAAFGLGLDATGNVYVTGPSLGADGDYDFAVIKYLSNGTESFVKRLEGPDGLDDNPQDVAVDSTGNIYVGGDTRSAAGHLNFLAVKIPQSTRTPPPAPQPTPGPIRGGNGEPEPMPTPGPIGGRDEDEP
jgi:hypothetical protein